MTDIREILQAIGEAMIRHMIFTLESKGKYPLSRQSSRLIKEMKADVKQGRNSLGRFEGFSANAKLELQLARYAEYLDLGRYSVSEKPNIKKVPLDAILGWLKHRRIRGRVRAGKGKGRFITQNQLAFMIQNAIYKNGIRGRHFIKPAYDEGQRLVEIYLDSKLLDDMTYQLEREWFAPSTKEKIKLL